jgi:glutathione S-transferase
MNCGLRIKLKEITANLQKDLMRIDELWNEGLSRFKGPYLAGNKFTAVDAFYAPVAFRLRGYGISLSPASQNYVNLILSTKSLLSWEEAALKESWREVSHEREALEYGVLIEDLRHN